MAETQNHDGSQTVVESLPYDPRKRPEPGCFAVTHEKKYYELLDNPSCETFIKRSLVPKEYLVNMFGKTVLPHFVVERLKNEVAATRYVKEHARISVPTVYSAFEDDGRYYVIQERVQGISMAEMPKEQKSTVVRELDEIWEVLHNIKSKRMGGIAPSACLPYRVDRVLHHEKPLEFRDSDEPEFVFCHGDLSQYNVIVDPETFKIKAILDWEYAGFYPPEFDRKFYMRLGPSIALAEEGEIDDVPLLLELVEKCRKD